jgi:hypothetical protein
MAVKPGLGLTLPIGLGGNGYFKVAYDALTQAKTNLTNLVLTKKGERVMQPSFGCNIHNQIFEHITSDIEANVAGAIEEAASIWMPFITINSVQLAKDEDRNRAYVTIVFSLKTNVSITDSITLVI